jgi:Fe-S-cluster-containing hydrogenase component 2
MALQINELCVNCWACEPLCPNEAIYEASPHFLIDAMKCTECLGDHDEPQCAAICPIECAIVDEEGESLNPPGSLTGIPPEKMAEVMAQLQAH